MLSYSPFALIDFVLPKWEADPDVRIEDAYKWLFQATRGGEHMVQSREAAAEALAREWESAEAVCEEEPLWEPLSPDEKIGRLNIRPFKHRGGSIGNLIDAFVASTKAFASEQKDFLYAWNELGRRLDARLTSPLDYSEWSRLDAVMRAKDYTAIRHSEAYRTARHPSYRILTAEEAKRLINGTG